MKLVDIEDCELEDDVVLYEGELFSGVLYSLYEDGQLEEEGDYLGGLPHGPSRMWYPSGKLWKEWNCFHGRVEGMRTEYFENGQRKHEEFREFGFLIEKKNWSPDGKLLEVWKFDPKPHIARYLDECRANGGDGHILSRRRS